MIKTKVLHELRGDRMLDSPCSRNEPEFFGYTFELAELHAQGRAAHPKFFRGIGYPAFVGYGLEIEKMMKVEPSH